MPLSVTRRLFAVAVALLVLASAGALGGRPSGQHPAATRAVAPEAKSSRRQVPLHLGRVTLWALAASPSPQAPTATARPVRPVPPAPPAAPGGAGQEFALVNQDRATNGVAPLALSSALARVAQYRAQDMLDRNYFSHDDPSTGQLAFLELFHLWGVAYTTAGENIAWSTNPSMVGINVMFMNSPEHRANILQSAYHHLGVGVASDGSKTMVVEVFSN